MVAGEIAGAWGNFGGFAPLDSNLAHSLELPIARNLETASRSERAQSSAWSHSARGRGNLRFAEGELVKINRDRSHQCVSDQTAEFDDRKKDQENRGNRYQAGRYRCAKRSPGRMRRDSSARDPKR